MSKNNFASILVIMGLCNILVMVEGVGRKKTSDRVGKILSPFQIVTFPNDVCSGGSKNGTCYTTAECSALGGSNDGSCANGFGVCCTFTVTCDCVSSQNCTYFDSSAITAGGCIATICPCNDNICQLRLDFDSFTIAGPSTDTTVVVKTLNGVPVQTSGIPQTAQSQCLTDTFSVTNPDGAAPSPICGINNGEHMYVESSSCCNDLVFQFKPTAMGTTIPTRSWSIKITQYSCDYTNLAPPGCTQYFFGATTNSFESYNYNNGNGQQLANQDQNICVRRESGNCRLCFYTEVSTDFDVSGLTTTSSQISSVCCGYTSGEAAGQGYDCLHIPNATKSVTSFSNCKTAFCGNAAFLSGGTEISKCTTKTPFIVNFRTDNWENAADTIAESAATDRGFRLSFVMDSINCG